MTVTMSCHLFNTVVGWASLLNAAQCPQASTRLNPALSLQMVCEQARLMQHK